MDLARLFVRMAYWLRRPPSRMYVTVAVIVIAIGAALYALEQMGMWPDALTLEPRSRTLVTP